MATTEGRPGMTRLLRHLERHGEEMVAQAALVLIAVCVFAQVVSRYVFNTAITWTEELAGFAMVWAVYMGASLAVRERFHIRILFAVEAMPRWMALPVILLGDLVWLGFCTLMLVQGWEYVSLMWRREFVSPSLGIDQVWPQSIVVIGYVLITLRLLQTYVIWLRNGRDYLPGIPPPDMDEPEARLQFEDEERDDR